MGQLTSSHIWAKLKSHQKDIVEKSAHNLFNNASRFEKFSIINDDFLFDYSKNIIDESSMSLLFELAEQSDLKAAQKSMLQGEPINWTENRSVLHTSLRDKSNNNIHVNSDDVKVHIENVLKKMKYFSEQVRSGHWTGYTNKPIKTVVNIGIGGSDLGPKMVVNALKYYADGPDILFVSNVDGTDIFETLQSIDPATTLFLIASKTFTTQETMTNAYTARDWIINSFDEKAVKNHFVALSTSTQKVKEFGIDTNNIFEFWDFIGGRYSTWSAIGMPIALSIGFENFDEFLRGGYEMDCHFFNTPFEENIPVIMGLLGIWYNNFFNAESHAILPYDQYLKYFSAHLQQVDMESNGKYIDKDGNKVDYQTGPVIWGEPGTNGQHAFYQLIHQGTKFIPADFIGFKKPLHPHEDHHHKLMSNYFAQTKALFFGLDKDDVISQLESDGLSQDEVDQLAPHKVFEGQRPTNSILIEKLTPNSLGRLLALYEHKIFVQGVIWRINSFDQWGVELGKKLANQILPEIESQKVGSHDSSTEGLLNHFLK
ncbi:MAG: glucose-6-phosphate isomerase [Candidatus Marinimicrobia bacterium]|jgi:glucose-6-phosphate isomerase|nr:glucose-6-phosphate isomerase [Candidatus Neomarinimicrobiota bacterium]MBT3961399.1 glucose-6-phosphate isomerase [Candidatus Neomarinimicrobiota bacterium]MBT4382763.1 glucose-6-phosphate isomerase [Candidatus Neomarinimicrobiota bacterium]MBT4636608.1 glucose-6-phosphate isomerase [Candidatus Neomarinimicrobiota bacterium]MBT4684726.1 glucose-6-phosphate isomerase [Candidatus Neomarinimicrobiota bacterium]